MNYRTFVARLSKKKLKMMGTTVYGCQATGTQQPRLHFRLKGIYLLWLLLPGQLNNSTVYFEINLVIFPPPGSVTMKVLAQNYSAVSGGTPFRW